MTLETIDRFERLLEIRHEWASFVRETDEQTPFQSPEWLLTWWRHFGSGRLHVLVFRKADAIAAFVPSFLHEWNGLRQLTLIGSGISDYLEPAIAPECRQEITTRLQEHLYTTHDWDICNWQDLSLDTPLRCLTSTEDFEIEMVGETECQRVSLCGCFKDYWQARPASLRQNVRRDRAKAESVGSLSCEVLEQADSEAIDALIALHTARWRKRGQPGMISVNGSGEFLRDIACEFAPRDMLRIFALRFDCRMAAVILAFRYRGRLFNYLTAFDPALENLGLGRTLLYEAIRYAFENGYVAWDFLRGNEPYKLWWGARTVPKCRLIATRRVPVMTPGAGWERESPGAPST